MPRRTVKLSSGKQKRLIFRMPSEAQIRKMCLPANMRKINETIAVIEKSQKVSQRCLNMVFDV